MPNTETTSQVGELIDELKEMASGKTDAARLGEIAATARRMDDAGQSIEACNVQGMAAALRGDTFEVERLFNAALQRGGNDAWTLGNYAAALNILASGLHGRECEKPCRPERGEQEHHRPQYFDAMPGYFYTLLHRPDGSYAMPLASDAIRELYGLGPEATTNDYSELLALVHPDDAAQRQRKLDESERDLSPFHAEYRIVLPQIGARWIEVHALPQRTGDGGTRWDGFINDITERKLMEDELRLKEFVLDQAQIGVYLIGENARITYVNDAACRALGYSREELLTKTTMDIDASHSVDHSMSIRRKTLDDGAFTFETRHVRRDGSLLPVEVWASMLEYQGKTMGVALAVDITERKCMEAELAARVRDFRSLAENIPDNIARWDVEGRFLYSNPTHQRTLGKSFDEMVGKTLGEIFPDGYYAPFEEVLARVVATGKEEYLQRVPARMPDGSMAIHDVRLTPEFDAEGRVVSVLGLGRDMTDIYRMQETIDAREREFRSLAENSPDNIARWDVEGRYLYLNPTHERTLGAQASDIIGTVIPATHPHVKAGIAQVAATGQAMVLVRQTVVVGGKLQIHEVRLAPERDADGRIISVLGLGRDMTDIYLMQETLAAREREFRSLAENSPDNIARYDCALRLTYLNPALAASLQANAGEVIGKHILEAFPGEDFRALADKLIETMQCGTVADFHVVTRDRGEGERIHHLRITPEHDKLGEVVSALVIGRDMTDTYRMQETIAAREQEFRSLAESSPDFIVRYDRDGRHRYLNTTLLRLLGLSSIDEVAGKRPSEAWPDGRFDQLEQAAARAVETGCNAVIELIAPVGSGEGSISQIFVVPERDVSGLIVGTIAFGRDISAIKGMQRQLTQFVANFPGFAYSFRMSPDGRGSFPFASPGIEKLYGLQPEDVKDDSAALHALAHPDDAPGIIAALVESARTMAPVHMEYRVCRPGLPEHWAEFRSSPVREADGSVVWYGIMLDITERKQTEQALQYSRTQLRGLIAQREEAREEERRYIAREIHDNLGQILSGLRLNVSRFVRRYAANSAEMQAYLRNTGELVDLAVQEVRNISAALRPVELEMDIRSALSSHLERFGAYTGIVCELNAGDDVDLTEENHKLALFRIAQESLTNVARHAQASKVEIALRMEMPHCILCIRDNGVGFDTGANKPKSFGLVGMRERVAMLGGSVIIDSSPGKGTEIVVRIPVQKTMEKS